MTDFNLSDWALRHQSLVLYFIIIFALMGGYAYQHLGQAEDPPFTFKIMVIRTLWPGATAREVEQQLTDKIEKKLQEAPQVDRIVSYSKPGESVVLFIGKDSAPADRVPEMFYQVRKKIGDIHYLLPSGIQGPFFNDEFGDVFGSLYALTGDGLNYAQLKDYGDKIRDELLKVKNVAKVELFGQQDEKIYIELSNIKLAMLGLDINTVLQALAQQNAIVGAGFFETPSDRIYLRPTGSFDSVENVRDTILRAAGKQFRIGDIAQVQRGDVDPPAPFMRYRGQVAIGLGVSMTQGGDIIVLGQDLQQAIQHIQANLPIGVELHNVASQPEAVKRSVHTFVQSLAEAVMIVLVVNFFSLGFRTGMVVALSIPLVLAMTFFLMWLFNVGLHKISLGALILALGLLVDDAIIAVEMMWVKIEQGWERVKAASFAYTSTAGPMLSGTLVTTAGFLPIATAASSTGEYTRSIFQVNVMALLLSWLVAVVVIPYLGYHLLPNPHAKKSSSIHHEVYDSLFYRIFRRVIAGCVRYRWLVIGITLIIFAASTYSFRFVQKQFFPSSTRLELLVDLRLSQGSSLKAVETQVRQLEAILAKEPGIDNFVAYIGWGSPRFYLALDQQLPATNFAQLVILTESIEAREALRTRLIQLFEKDFHGLWAHVSRLENGPPVGFPIQFRVSGEDISTLRQLAHQIAEIMRVNPHLSNVQFDWEEESKVIDIKIDQDKARLLGMSSQELSNFLNASLNGYGITTFREGDEAIEVVLRGGISEREQLSLLENLSILTKANKSVPLTQLASIHYGFEPGVIWRRNRLPTITIRANVYGDIQAPTVTEQINPLLDPIRAQLPKGYLLEIGGAVEESSRGQESVMVGIPLFVLAVFTILMLQLQSVPKVIMVVLTAPLGLVGVTLFLILFNQPFGFVAMLGTIALFGMIMRNSVILVDQIQQDIEAGRSEGEAVVESTVRRFRPIVLTAAAAILAMIPLTRNPFFGPMAVAIMGGLIVATLLTLFFLPALYAAWYRVRG